MTHERCRRGPQIRSVRLENATGAQPHGGRARRGAAGPGRCDFRRQRSCILPAAAAHRGHRRRDRTAVRVRLSRLGGLCTARQCADGARHHRGRLAPQGHSASRGRNRTRHLRPGRADRRGRTEAYRARQGAGAGHRRTAGGSGGCLFGAGSAPRRGAGRQGGDRLSGRSHGARRRPQGRQDPAGRANHLRYNARHHRQADRHSEPAHSGKRQHDRRAEGAADRRRKPVGICAAGNRFGAEASGRRAVDDAAPARTAAAGSGPRRAARTDHPENRRGERAVRREPDADDESEEPADGRRGEGSAGRAEQALRRAGPDSSGARHLPATGACGAGGRQGGRPLRP